MPSSRHLYPMQGLEVFGSENAKVEAESQVFKKFKHCTLTKEGVWAAIRAKAGGAGGSSSSGTQAVSSTPPMSRSKSQLDLSAAALALDSDRFSEGFVGDTADADDDIVEPASAMAVLTPAAVFPPQVGLRKAASSLGLSSAASSVASASPNQKLGSTRDSMAFRRMPPQVICGF